MKRVVVVGAIAAFSASAIADNHKFMNNIKLKGDIRYRYENTSEEEFSGGNVTSKPNQARHRVRARIHARAKISKHFHGGVSLSSGDGKATSHNQTFTGGFGQKSSYINQAYLKFKYDRFKAIGGKHKNKFERAGKNQLVFDNDIRLEGITLNWKDDLGKWGYQFTGGYYVLQENAGTRGQAGTDLDKEMIALQGSFNIDFNKRYNLKFGSSLYDFERIGAGDARIDGNGNYATPYSLFELYTEFKAKTSIAFSAHANYLSNVGSNSTADQEDTAWNIGVKIGRGKMKGDWQFGWDYRQVELYSTFAEFYDSNFGDLNGEGHKLNVKYLIEDNVHVGLTTYFVNNNMNDVGNGTEDLEFMKTQLDLVANF